MQLWSKESHVIGAENGVCDGREATMSRDTTEAHQIQNEQCRHGDEAQSYADNGGELWKSSYKCVDEHLRVAEVMEGPERPQHAQKAHQLQAVQAVADGQEHAQINPSASDDDDV